MNKVERQGTCSFCGRNGIIEKHHVSYRPERTLVLCHACHFKVHYFPARLTLSEIKKMLGAKLTGSEIMRAYRTPESLNKACDDLALTLSYHAKGGSESLKTYQKEVAPSRKEHRERTTAKV